MPSTSHSLLNYLRVWVGAWHDDPRDDATLLARFAEGDDEAAFRVLVCRHGPLVWQTCRRVLGDTPDAEDAFQTTFLALARKARRLRREPLAGWLHRVARQTALNADAEVRRRRGLEQRLRTVRQPASEEEVSRTDLYVVLDEELAGLPERLRVPLVLRYLEGKTLAEVAQILGCSLTPVTKRLARGEAILRERLERRGLTVGVVSIGALLGNTFTASAVPACLIGSTTRAALRSLSFPLELSTSSALEGVMKTMLVTKVKLVAVLLGMTLCLAGGGLLAYQALAGNAAEPPQAAGKTRGAAEASGQPGAMVRVDCFGDPLPTHALARMGTIRLWPSSILAFSPDGKTLASPLGGMTVCLWDAATGKEIRRLTAKAIKGWIHSLGFSPDGKTLVAMDGDRTVCQWEVATGQFLRKQEYQGPKRRNVRFLKVAFLPDGKILGFGDYFSKPKYVWDVATGKEICQLSRPMKEGVGEDKSTAFSSDGKLLATAVNVNTEKRVIISLWDVATGKEIRQLIYKYKDDWIGVEKVAFSPDGKTLASGDHHQIFVWEIATGKKIHLLQAGAERARWGGPLTYSPDSKTLLGGKEGHLWDVGTGKEIRSFGWKDVYSNADARVALFSPDGKTLAMGDQMGSLRLYEVATGKEIGPRKGYRGVIRSVVYSPDGKTLASMGEDETVRLWQVTTGKEMRPLAKHARWGSRSIAYSPDGKMLVSVEENVEENVLHLWDTATGKEIRQFKVGDYPRSVTFSPDGKKLAASASKDDQPVVRVWEVATGRKIYTLPTGIQSPIEPWSVVFSSDGRLLAAPGNDNTVFVWEVATGKPIGQLAGRKQPARQGNPLFVRFLVLSPDSRMLATSSRDDDKIHVWEVASGKEIWQLDGLKNNRDGYKLDFSPDGRILATAAQGLWGDFVVHLLEMASGKEIGQLIGHQALVRTIAFSPDGKTLASGSDDLTCLVWDITPFGGRLKPVLAPPLPAQALSKEQLEAAWADLSKDPAKAYTAIRVLQAVPTQAIALLEGRVRPVAPVADPQQLKRWIADLDDNSFTVRDKAQRGIENLGEVAIPALRQALKDQPALEVKRRLQTLLAELEPQVVVVSPRRLSELRAVQVLESIGTAEARQVLQAWAKGVAEAGLTREAQAALVRLAKRSAAGP